METVMMVLAGLAGVVGFVCWIMVLIKIFQNAGVGLGILGIFCGLFTFIYGWIKSAEYDCKKVMLIWTVAWVVSIGANLLGAGAAFQQILQGAESGGMPPMEEMTMP